MTTVETAPSHPRRAGAHRERPGSVTAGRSAYVGFTVSPLTPHIDAEVDGLDLARPQGALRQQRLHLAHPGPLAVGEPGDPRFAVPPDRHHPTAVVSGAVGAEHVDAVGQPVHAAPRDLGLLPTHALGRACVGGR